MRIGRILKIIGLSALMALTAAVTAFADDSVYITGSKINSYQVGGMTPEEAMQMISANSSNYYRLTIHEKDGATETISYDEIDMGAAFAVEPFREVLNLQNANGRVFGSNVPLNTEIAGEVTYSAEKLEARMNALSCISAQQKTENARISAYKEGESFTILPEVEGNSLDTERTKEAIRQAVHSRQTELDLNALGVYDQITIRQGDESLNRLLEQMNAVSGLNITYSIKGAKEVLSGSVIATWISGSDANGQMALNMDSVRAYVADMAKRHDTAGTYRTFKGGSGAQVGLTTSYGWRIDQAAETEALAAAIKGLQSQEREPVWAKRGKSAAMPEWGGTFVEVDMARQHVYFFRDGAVVWDAPCVTGNVSKNYTTPDGVYSIYSKERNRVLRGKIVNGKPEYESPVSYWMPFNGGIGLHDADWRGSFGGSIYKTNGSHGCVNLPPSKVPALYDLVSVGTVVVCHN